MMSTKILEKSHRVHQGIPIQYSSSSQEWRDLWNHSGQSDHGLEQAS